MALALLAGCSTTPPPAPKVVDLIELNQKATDALLQDAALSVDKPLLVAAFVDMDQLTESSRLGRLFSEQVTGRLAQRGYRVVELKLRDKLFMKKGQGALMLSTELSELSQSQQAQAVVVGSYTNSGETLYLSIKLVSARGNIILAAYDYSLPLDSNVRGLLR
ncbi:FlgO family outer membrane protein [Roseateles sp.]|uniref:FlgO family outer membrane protein n=1 Tax=Roseateles sp. TaxID=1971397 RepID=UPI0039EB8C37